MKQNKRVEASFCEVPARQPEKGTKSKRSAVYRHKGNCRWQGVRDERYKKKGDGWSGIVRRVLVGGRGETARFHVRYFEIAPGGNSSLEHHRHEHVVICVRGRGIVLIGKRRKTVSYLDTIYISPDIPHQLSNPFDEPFGFFCIVNARRDRPKVLTG